MKNVKSYGVQEMSTHDMKKTDGGFWHLIVGAVIFSLGMEVLFEGTAQCWEDFKAGFKEGIGG